MRLVKQSLLYFKEGNSDKVYEIDLCDVGNDRYVVNFRYGKRNTQLKEGSKTPVPVALQEAERIYDQVETEKINKGYTTSSSGVSSLPAKKAFTPDSNNIPLSTVWPMMPPGRNKAILQRLQDALDNNSDRARFQWKLSRIIWKAGEYRVKEAAPFIVRLFDKGNQLHQYCCTWSLIRCTAGDPLFTGILQSIHNDHPSAAIAKIAGAGLVKNLNGAERAAHLIYYLHRLPEDIRSRVEQENTQELEQLLNIRIAQQQPAYNWLEDLYLLSFEKRWLTGLVKKILLQLPLQPGYFKHLRAIFKLSELLDDFEIQGMLACRFEREPEMFNHHIAIGDSKASIFIPEIEEWINPVKELKKNSSRLAYSQKTRWYFHRRVLRTLQMTGSNEDPAYVKLATALLIAYKFKLDFREHYSSYNYEMVNNRYERLETRFLQNAHAVFMHQILSGNNSSIALQSNNLWRINSGRAANPKKATLPGEGLGLGGFIKKITGLFGKKKDTAPQPEPEVKKEPNPSGTPFLHLWNKAPRAYIQLLMDAEMGEVHQFAQQNLLIHPEFAEIKSRLDQSACIKLLSSTFAIPAQFGFALVMEKYAASIPTADLVLAMLNSIHQPAVEHGKQWTEAHQANYLQQGQFITGLIFAKHAAVRAWVKTFLQNNALSGDVKNAAVARSVAELLHFQAQTKENEAVIKDAADTLAELFKDELKTVNIGIISDLLQHENGAVLMFGLRLLGLQKQHLQPESLSKEFLLGLLRHSYAPVREEGIALLTQTDDKALSQYHELVTDNCISVYENVRQGLAPVIGRMAMQERLVGVTAAQKLLPFLLRKETVEGLHADIAILLRNELSDFLTDVDKQTALNLLYSTYTAAQNVGIMILEKYTDPAQLSIPQVIALGAHENLQVREWSWKFYKEQSPRIRFEKETAIRLLESKWQDSRVFAMQYFREQFSANDWNPVTLVTLADSVKPDVEAFGRELITRFFTPESGVEYLMQLSQHPSEKMQLFATNYLERFAAGDIEKIKALDFYFRSVLTRVNKSRIAKNRIYSFLLQEGRQSEPAAKIVCTILSDVSATASIGDKATCIEILLRLNALYDVAVPVRVKAMEIRT